MIRVLRQNLGLKLVSLLLAIIIWIIVMNISKPEVNSSMTVPLSVLHQNVFGSKKVWEMSPTIVSVGYTVRADQLRSISASDFSAYVDLKDYSLTGSVPVYAEAVGENKNIIGNVSSRTPVARIKVEDIQEKEFNITFHGKGYPAENYVVSNAVFSPQTVIVTGPESKIGRISEVGIVIDVTNVRDDLQGSGKLDLFDANGNKIEDLDILPQSAGFSAYEADGSQSEDQKKVRISTDVAAYYLSMNEGKNIAIQASVEGNPALGFEYESITLSQDFIALSGPVSLMEQLNSISLPPVDITDMRGDVTVTYNIADSIKAYIEHGVSLSAAASPEVSVTVHIGRAPEIVRSPQSLAVPPEGVSEEGTETETESDTLPADQSLTGSGSSEEGSESGSKESQEGGSEGKPDGTDGTGTSVGESEREQSDEGSNGDVINPIEGMEESGGISAVSSKGSQESSSEGAGSAESSGGSSGASSEGVSEGSSEGVSGVSAGESGGSNEGTPGDPSASKERLSESLVEGSLGSSGDSGNSAAMSSEGMPSGSKAGEEAGNSEVHSELSEQSGKGENATDGETAQDTSDKGSSVSSASLGAHVGTEESIEPVNE